jgi:hypothetical protein
LSDDRSIFRRWLKAMAVTRCNTLKSQGKRGSGRAVSCTTAEWTLGAGVKASGGRVITIPHVAAPLRQQRQPPVMLGSRFRNNPLGHFLLEHQRQR